MEEILKPIQDFDDYYISNFGNVYSKKSGFLKKLIPALDGQKNYLLIGLSRNGQRHRKLVHRLVAQAFIPNPHQLPEVNHRDKNKKNNHVSNLEWCTRKENLEDSYSTMSPNRNFNKCTLFVNNEEVGEFDGVIRAAKFAHEHYGASASSLEKYLKWLNIEIKIDGDDTRKKYEGHTCERTQNRKTIFVYKEEQLVGEFKRYKDVKQFLETHNIFVSEDYVRFIRNKGRDIQGFKIIR